ncbi:MAG TPA: hypothetical protein VIJ39_09195 [Solirubrobacteraceae bacterium]
MASIVRSPRAPLPARVRLFASAALAGTLALIALASWAPTAWASVTASSITSPAGPLYTLNDTTLSNSPAAFTVQGTFSGSSSAHLAINCYYADGSHETVAEDVEGVEGSFSVPVSSSSLEGGAPCVLRAVPAEDYGSYPPGSEGPYQGLTLASSELYVSTFAGIPFDYDLTSVTPGGGHAFSSAGACGLGSSGLYLSSTLSEVASPLDCDGALYAEEPLEAKQGTQSEIRIDGINAYGPYAAEHLFGQEPGVPGLSVSTEFDASSGQVAVHETDPIVVCSPDPTTFPPTAQSCSSFLSAGVSLKRTWQTEDSGATVSLEDSWTSSDDATHSLVALYDNHLQSAGAQAAGFMFPGSSSFSDFADEAKTTLPEGPGTIYYTGDNGGSTDDGEDHPYAAIGYDTPPDGAVTFTRSDMSAGGEGSSFVMPYERTIPAGGAFTLHLSFAQAPSLSEVRDLVGGPAAPPSEGPPVSEPPVSESPPPVFDPPVSEPPASNPPPADPPVVGPPSSETSPPFEENPGSETTLVELRLLSELLPNVKPSASPSRTSDLSGATSTLANGARPVVTKAKHRRTRGRIPKHAPNRSKRLQCRYVSAHPAAHPRIAGQRLLPAANRGRGARHRAPRRRAGCPRAPSVPGHKRAAGGART